MDRGMVREGVRMYDRDVVELALLALEEGMSQQEAAELCGASRGTVGYWARGRLPHGRRAPSAGLHAGVLGWPLRTRRRSR